MIGCPSTWYRFWTGRSANWKTASLQCPRSAYHNRSGSSSNKPISGRRIVRRPPGSSREGSMSDGKILRTFPKLPLNKRVLLTMAFDHDVTDRLNAIRTRYSPSKQIKIWKHTESVMFPELPISQSDLYHETFNTICSQGKSFPLGRGQFEFYQSKNDPRRGELIPSVPVTTELRDIYDQPSSMQAKKMRVALKRDYPLGIDLGLLKSFNLYLLSRESFSGAPGTLTMGTLSGVPF